MSSTRAHVSFRFTLGCLIDERSRFHFVLACLLKGFQRRAAQVPYEQTKAINQWRSVGKSPFSDECLVQLTSEERYDDSGNLLVEEETRGVYLTCTYEEDIATASAQRRFACAIVGRNNNKSKCSLVFSPFVGQTRCGPRLHTCTYAEGIATASARRRFASKLTTTATTTTSTTTTATTTRKEHIIDTLL